MLSISIVVYKPNIEILKKTIDSVYHRVVHDCKIQHKTLLIIIDNGNQKSKIEAIVKPYTENNLIIRIVSGIKNVGYGRGHNIAILDSNSDYHLILNPDVILDKNSLKNGLEYLDLNLDVVSVCPKCRDKDDNPQYIAKKYPCILDLFLRGFLPKTLKKYFDARLSKYEIRDIINKDQVAEIEIMSGCFMLCRTEALKKIKGFDERYFLYFEDYALSIELARYGKLKYLPTMSITHFGGHAARKGISHIIRFLLSGLKFFNRYGWKLI